MEAMYKWVKQKKTKKNEHRGNNQLLCLESWMKLKFAGVSHAQFKKNKL